MLHQVPLSILRAFEAAGRTGSFRAAAHGTQPDAERGEPRRPQARADARREPVRARQSGRAPEPGGRGADAPRRPRLRRVAPRPGDGLDARAPAFAPAQRAQLRRALAQPAPRPVPARHPGVEVRLAAGTDYTRFLNDEFDADIVYGPPRLEGLVVVPLGRGDGHPAVRARSRADDQGADGPVQSCPDRERDQAGPLVRLVRAQRAARSPAAGGALRPELPCHRRRRRRPRA